MPLRRDFQKFNRLARSKPEAERGSRARNRRSVPPAEQHPPPSFSLCGSLRWARPQVENILVEIRGSVRLEVSVHSPPRLVRFNLVSVSFALLPTRT